VKTGVQGIYKYLKILDSGFRRNDEKGYFQTFYAIINLDEFVKSPVPVIARSSVLAGRRSNLVFSGTYKNEIASVALAMTLSRLFTKPSTLESSRMKYS